MSKLRVSIHESTLSFISQPPELPRWLKIQFVRTLRIPDDGRKYKLPAGLGILTVRNVNTIPNASVEMRLRGGVVVPAYENEAIWISFSSASKMKAAVQVGLGKVCAVSGRPWTDDLVADPQNYVALPGQKWIDGCAVSPGVVKQFVLARLGDGKTVEEQVTGSAEWGGMQIRVCDTTAAYRAAHRPRGYRGPHVPRPLSGGLQSKGPITRVRAKTLGAKSLGVGIGGTIEQKIYEDKRSATDYDQVSAARVFVHLVGPSEWTRLTGEAMPHRPLDRAIYNKASVPWFDVSDAGLDAIAGSFAGVQTADAIDSEPTVSRASSPYADLDGDW